MLTYYMFVILSTTYVVEISTESMKMYFPHVFSDQQQSS